MWGLFCSRERSKLLSLIDDLKSAQAKKPQLAEWLISRTPEERAAFEQTIDDHTVAIDALCNIVRAHGGSVSRGTMEAMRESRVAR